MINVKNMIMVLKAYLTIFTCTLLIALPSQVRTLERQDLLVPVALHRTLRAERDRQDFVRGAVAIDSVLRSQSATDNNFDSQSQCDTAHVLNPAYDWETRENIFCSGENTRYCSFSDKSKQRRYIRCYYKNSAAYGSPPVECKPYISDENQHLHRGLYLVREHQGRASFGFWNRLLNTRVNTNKLHAVYSCPHGGVALTKGQCDYQDSIEKQCLDKHSHLALDIYEAGYVKELLIEQGQEVSDSKKIWQTRVIRNEQGKIVAIETQQTKQEKQSFTEADVAEKPPQKATFAAAALRSKYNQQTKSKDVPSDTAKLFAAVRVAREKNSQSQRIDSHPVTEVQEDTQVRDLAALNSAVTHILANFDHKLTTHPASQKNPKSVVLATLQELIHHTYNNLAEGNIDEAIKGASTLEVIAETMSGKESFVFSKEADPLASAISSRPYYGVTPELCEESIEFYSGDEEYLAHYRSAGHVIYNEVEQFAGELKEGAKTLEIILGVAIHAMNNSTDLRSEIKELHAKQERGEILTQFEQGRLQRMTKHLAIREQVLKNITVKKVAHKVIEQAVTAGPYLALQYACPGIAPRIFMALKALDIASHIAEKTLAKKAEQLYGAVQTDSSETVAVEMAKTYVPLQGRLDTNANQDNQHIIHSIERTLKNKAYDHLAKGNLKKAADTTVTSMLIDTIISSNKSSLYNPETDRLLLKMIKTNPHCRKLFEEGKLTVPENKSLADLEAEWLVQATIAQAEPPQNLQDALKNESLAARNDDNGVTQGVKNVQEEALNRQRQVQVIFDLFKSAYQDPAKTGAALVETAAEEAGGIIVRKGINWVFDTTINETLGRLQDNVRKDCRNLLLELGTSIDKNKGPVAKATAHLFQELADACDSDTSQVAEALGNIVLEFAKKAEYNDKITARDMFLNAAIVMEARGDQAGRVTLSMCKSIADALDVIISEEIDNSSS